MSLAMLSRHPGSVAGSSDYLGPSASQVGRASPPPTSPALSGTSDRHSALSPRPGLGHSLRRQLFEDTVKSHKPEKFSDLEASQGDFSMRRHSSMTYHDLNTSLPLDLYKTDPDEDRLNVTLDNSRLDGGTFRSRLSYRRGVDHGGGDRSAASSPLRALHDLKINGHDCDSGIRSMMSPHGATHSSQELSRDHRSASCGRTVGSLSRCFGSVPDLQNALHDSEDRRQLLMDKLRDAQDTIKYQARKMNHIESYTRESSHELDDLKGRSKEYERKIENLEKERRYYHEKELEYLGKREELQKKLEIQEEELKTLRNARGLFQTDSRRKQDTIDQTILAMNILEDENTKLIRELFELLPQCSRSLQAKENALREMAALKESLDLARARNQYLENDRKDGSNELVTLRTEQRSLSKKNEELMSQNYKLTTTNMALKEENKSLVNNVQTTNKDKTELLDRLSSMTSTVGELKATLSAVNADKDRYFRETVDLKTQIHALRQDKENLIKIRNALDEQINEMNADFANLNLAKDRSIEEKRRTVEELDAVKKVGEVLSLELSGTKSKLEQLVEQVQCLEQTKAIAYRQHQVYEQEIASLESQMEAAKKSIESAKQEHVKEKEGLENVHTRLKEELRQIKAERNSLEAKCHDLEQQAKQVEKGSKEQRDIQVRELDVWKTNCEKLTGTLSRKEMEIQTLVKRTRELEEQVNHLKVNHETHQSQYEELVESRQEVIKLEEDKRRLIQEKAENQQVIQLLEMQKNILTKTSEDNMTKAQDMEKFQYQVQQLKQENKALEDKVLELEKARQVLKKEKELQSSLTASMETNSSRIRELEKQVEHLQNMNDVLTEQSTSLEKENKALRSKDEDKISRSEYRMIEQEKINIQENYQHLKAQFNDLEGRYHKVLTDKGALFAEGDVGKLQLEKQNLESELAMVQSKILVLENGKRRADDQVKALQAQVDELQFSSIGCENNAKTVSLQCQVVQLKADLDKSKQMQEKQEALIHSLKEKSLDDVGEELTQVKSELQKLMEVITEKDVLIEQLEEQLRASKMEVEGRDEVISRLRMNPSSPKKKQSNTYSDDGSVDREELEDELDHVTAERNAAKKEVLEVRAALEDMEKMYDEEKQRLMDKMRRELQAKDRQIESLEEQLRRTTKVELKKLKRDAGKVELLKAENRRLQSQLIIPHKSDLLETSGEHMPQNGVRRPSTDHTYDFLDSDSSSEDLVEEAIEDQITSADRHLWSMCKKTTSGSLMKDDVITHLENRSPPKVVMDNRRLADSLPLVDQNDLVTNGGRSSPPLASLSDRKSYSQSSKSTELGKTF